MMPFRKKTFGFCVAAGVFLGLLVCYVWLSGPNRQLVVSRNTENSCLQFDALLGHSYIPNCKGIGKRGKFIAQVQHNALGIRGPEYPPRSDKFRILLLGSSDYYAMGLTDPQTPAALFERNLQKKLGYSVEVINAAAEGYSTLQHEVWLPKLMKAYSPNLVIASLVSTDYSFRDRYLYALSIFNAGNLSGFKWLPQQVLPEALMNRVIRNSNDYQLWHTLIQQGIRLRNSWEFKLRHWWNKEAAYLWLEKPTLDSLLRMQKIATASGAQFLVMDQVGQEANRQYVGVGVNTRIVRFLNHFHPQIVFPHASTAAFFEKNLAASYRAAESAEVVWYGDNAQAYSMNNWDHLNEAGCEVLANNMAKLILPMMPIKRSRKK